MQVRSRRGRRYNGNAVSKGSGRKGLRAPSSRGFFREPVRPGIAEGTVMNASGSIFLDFTLPNATTWFVFSLLLTVAVFFKFSRLLSVRNLDVLTLFLMVPGLLILQEAHTQQAVLAAGRVAQV